MKNNKNDVLFEIIVFSIIAYILYIVVEMSITK